MKKMRKDSTYLSMPRCLQQAVDDMLMDGAGLEDVQQRVAEDGIKWSINSISKYNRRWIEPFRREDRREIAEMINKQDLGDLDAATAQLARETTFDLLTAKKKDPATIKMMTGIVQSYTKLKLEKDRLQLDIDKWQTMAAQALLDKALSPEVQAIVNGEGSDAQKVAMLRPLLFGKAQTITPEFING